MKSQSSYRGIELNDYSWIFLLGNDGQIMDSFRKYFTQSEILSSLLPPEDSPNLVKAVEDLASKFETYDPMNY